MQDSTSMTTFMNGYRYIISIQPESKLFSPDGPFGAVQNPREFKIRSQQFGSAEACESKLNNIMSTLAFVNRKLDGKQYVLAKTVNPVAAGKEQKEGDNWTADLMLKAFITDVEQLKKGETFEYDIQAEIRIAPFHLSVQSMATH